MMQHRDVRTVLSVMGSSLGGWSSAMCLGRRSFSRAKALAHVAAVLKIMAQLCQKTVTDSLACLAG